jgi:hypothetical protein
MSDPIHEFLIDTDGLMWCGEECPGPGDHHQGERPIGPWTTELTRDDLWVRDTVKKNGEWTIVDHPCSPAEFDAICRKWAEDNGFVKLYPDGTPKCRRCGHGMFHPVERDDEGHPASLPGWRCINCGRELDALDLEGDT